jgi:hypothetical protein
MEVAYTSAGESVSGILDPCECVLKRINKVGINLRKAPITSAEGLNEEVKTDLKVRLLLRQTFGISG